MPSQQPKLTPEQRALRDITMAYVQEVMNHTLARHRESDVLERIAELEAETIDLITALNAAAKQATPGPTKRR